MTEYSASFVLLQLLHPPLTKITVVEDREHIMTLDSLSMAGKTLIF